MARTNEKVYKTEVLVNQWDEDGKTLISVWTLNGVQVFSGEINQQVPPANPEEKK